MGNSSRHPRGVPTGGQFAPTQHAEANIDLGAQVNAALDGLADRTQAMKRPTRVELAARLTEAEREFEDAGGRGVDLAEEIDELRAALDRMDGTPDSEGRYITWADEDGDFLLSDGDFGNPGCDSCGEEDAVVRVDGRYLCELHAGDNGIERPEPDFRGDDPYDIADTWLGQKLISDGDPAYPNGRCGACGQGLSDSGSCRDFECSNGPDEPDEQSMNEMKDHAGTTVIRGIDILTGDQSLGDVRELHPDFPEEKWEAAMQNLREIRDWLHGVSEDVGDDIR